MQIITIILIYIWFPKKDKEPTRYVEWVRNCRRVREPAATSVLYSQHFLQACFDRTGQIVRLRDGAVPTLFDLPQHIQVWYLFICNLLFILLFIGVDLGVTSHYNYAVATNLESLICLGTCLM